MESLLQGDPILVYCTRMMLGKVFAEEGKNKVSLQNQ